MKAAMILTLMGDLNVEFSATLESSFSTLRRDCLTYRGITTSVGGTAANLAFAAKRFFAKVNVIGRVGEDALGQHIDKSFADQNVSLLCPHLPDKSTGISLYIRDSTPVHHCGIRLLISDKGANRFVDVADIERNRAVITGSNALFVDGYCFVDEPRRGAADLALDIARDAGVLVAFDLVPHDAHRVFTLDETSRWLKKADMIITEVRTIRRLFGLESDDVVIDLELVDEAFKVLKDKFGEKYFNLRFGTGNIERSMLCRPGRTPELRWNYYVETNEPRGFGDRLSATELAEYLDPSDSASR
jgi:sugar/nucleoside kinase (ribokinase family)